MAPPPSQLDPPRAKDYAWAVVAGVFAILFSVNVVAVLVVIATLDFPRLLLAPFSLLVTYWFMAGAFRRTTWGRRDDRPPPPGPPVLSERTATIYITIALCCALALAIATAVQILIARS